MRRCGLSCALSRGRSAARRRWRGQRFGRQSKSYAEPGLIAAVHHTDPLVRMFVNSALETFESPRARRGLDELARPRPRGDVRARGDTVVVSYRALLRSTP